MRRVAFVQALFLLVAVQQTAQAQKLIVYKTNNSTLEIKASEIDSIVFAPDELPQPSLLTCPDGNHPHAIDLGLPSGTKWACCNVGAAEPQEYGCYFAWGEAYEKSIYNSETYSLDGKNIGSDIAGSIYYDIALVNMGEPWRMPTKAQMKELMSCMEWDANSLIKWEQKNDISGILITGPNGGQIFLPAAGSRSGKDLNKAGTEGNYWSSNSYRGGDYADPMRFYPSYSEGVDIYEGQTVPSDTDERSVVVSVDWSNDSGREQGYSVRAVCQ